MARRQTQANTRSTVFAFVIVMALLAGLAVMIGVGSTYPFVSLAALAVAVGAPITGLVLWLHARNRAQAERLAAAQYAYQLQLARSHEVARYHMMGDREFEEALAFLCARDGCAHAQRAGGRGDLGADVIAFAPDGRKIVLQAKRYVPTNKVTGPDLQKFGGTCFSVHGAHVAAVVATSTFTKQAHQYAAHLGIRLFDADALAAWASRTGPAPWH